MLEKFLEKHRQPLIGVLSGLILLGAGISLGVGLIEMQWKSPAVQSVGLGEVGAGKIAATSVRSEKLGRININTASATELELLSGIGPVKAQSIIEYRRRNGLFKTASEIMDVSGIGPKTYVKIKSQITVE